MSNNIENLIIKLSKDPFNAEINFECALEYEKLNQTASAVSFYLRAAEYGYEDNQEIVYTSLLKMAKCFEDQNDRSLTVTNCLLQAISYLPSRPEAYFLMSLYYEQTQQWQECYTWSSMGLEHVNNKQQLPADVGYISKYSLIFQKAVSAWWIGRKDEGLSLLKLVENEYKSIGTYMDIINKNIQIMEK